MGFFLLAEMKLPGLAPGVSLPNKLRLSLSLPPHSSLSSQRKLGPSSNSKNQTFDYCLWRWVPDQVWDDNDEWGGKLKGSKEPRACTRGFAGQQKTPAGQRVSMERMMRMAWSGAPSVTPREWRISMRNGRSPLPDERCGPAAASESHWSTWTPRHHQSRL